MRPSPSQLNNRPIMMPALDRTSARRISCGRVHGLGWLSPFIPANLLDSTPLRLKAADQTDWPVFKDTYRYLFRWVPEQPEPGAMLFVGRSGDACRIGMNLEAAHGSAWGSAPLSGSECTLHHTRNSSQPGCHAIVVLKPPQSLYDVVGSKYGTSRPVGGYGVQGPQAT